jgi:hypothetical protein
MLRKQFAETPGSDVPDSESQDSATLADDLAGLYLGAKEGLLSIPEHAGRIASPSSFPTRLAAVSTGAGPAQPAS